MDSQRSSKDQAILTSVAESIGSTLGTIAAKAGSVQKALRKKVMPIKVRARRVAKGTKGTKGTAKKGTGGRRPRTGSAATRERK